MTFLYLKNLGSPTRWDVERYFKYRDRSLLGVSSDLSDMISDDRFIPGTERTFWHATLLLAQINKHELKFVFTSDSSKFMYEFDYVGVREVHNEFVRIKAMPSLVMQELTLLRGGIYRHALVDLIGRGVVVYAENVKFIELSRQ